MAVSAPVRAATRGLSLGGRGAFLTALAAHGVAIAAAVWWQGTLERPGRVGSGDVFEARCVAPSPAFEEPLEAALPEDLPPVPPPVAATVAEPPASEPEPDPVLDEILPDASALPPAPETLWPLAAKRVRSRLTGPTAPPATTLPVAAAPAAAPRPAPPAGLPARAGQSLRPLRTPRPAAPAWLTLTAPLRLDLRFYVEADGTLGEVRVARSSGLPRLDEEVRAFVAARWRFEPPGTPRWAVQAIQFALAAN